MLATHAFQRRSGGGRSLLKALFFLGLAGCRRLGRMALPATSPDRCPPPGPPRLQLLPTQPLPRPQPSAATAASRRSRAPHRNPGPATPRVDPAGSTDPEKPAGAAALASADSAAPLAEEPAPPPPPPAPKPAVLTVAPAWDSAMSLRLGGKVWTLDRERRLELAAGSYKLKFAIESPVYSHVEELTVRLAEGESRRITSPIERPGKLTVQPHINARQAFVRLDGAPAVATPLRGRWLAPGPHIVEIVATPDPASPVLQQGEHRDPQRERVDPDLRPRRPEPAAARREADPAELIRGGPAWIRVC